MATQVTPRHGGGTLSAKVLKVMGIFSGVQLVGILCSIIRTKLVAIWLGPAGVGLFGLYNSVIETAGTLTQMGTGTGVIRALAMSPRQMLPRLVTVTRRWAWALGLIGAFLTVILSPVLSRFTFGDTNHTAGFILIAGGILLLSLSNNEGAVFQGLKKYTKLAKATVAGSVAGLAVSVPMFYLWGLDSIIPSILAYIIVTWICRGLYRERIPRPTPSPGIRETFTTGKDFVLLGLFITITSFAANAVSYVFMSYLNRVAGTETAGLYQAGFTLVNRYTGLVLGAVGMEYLPRLSEVSKSRHRTEIFLSHEIILLTLVIFPVITVFIVADELIVKLLYDRPFLVMLPFVTWAVVGTVLRAWSWCLGFTVLARGDGVCYLVTELASAVVAIVLNIAFFNHFGIAGLGYAYLLWYVFYLSEMLIVCRRRYNLRISRNAFIVPLTALGASLAAAAARGTLGWWGALPFAILSLAVSSIGLKKMLGSSPLELLKKFVKPTKKG